ncbi:GspE/PulE family protein [Actomonas aquatica]|uniref:GspE/PulE family protein n=1 Tax=Actomonas aquatica TaxID=2866162 RepID=A0ABZ1C9Y7_9BACT|nr:GspE/PulE family protein [Opitutus sp. WL0086]WRQ88043.1 GspE/PulE family protein [Opitutus sp. WL0086]
MFPAHQASVETALREQGLVDDEQVEAARAEQESTGRTLVELLIAQGAVTLMQVLEAVAGHLHLRLAAELPVQLPGEAASLLSGDQARTYGVAPVRADAHAVEVLAMDPFNARVVEELTFALGREVEVLVAEPDKVEALIKQHYGEDEATLEDMLADVAGLEGANDATSFSAVELEEMAGQAPLIRFVNLVLAQAIKDGASDVHFEPFEHDYKIRYRVDGALFEMAPPPKHLALPIASRLKVLANLNIAERRVPQDGRIKITLKGRPVDLRVSTLPTQFGESVVLRVLDQGAVRLELGEIGLPAHIESGVRDIIKRPNGILVVTGPTGSGKTTTLYSALRELNDPERKLLTAEDPVEYEIEGVMQVPVNAGIGLSFERVLRSFLRQDPDVIMVGEIRDVETARIAIQASLTGHLVLATLHTNDAPGAVTRLIDMGVEPYLISSTLGAVLAQRLVRRLCPSCREAYEPSASELAQLEMPTELRAGRPLYRPCGCDACGGSGYRGRRGLFEWLPISETMRGEIAGAAAGYDLRRRALTEGMVPLREAGWAALLEGETSAAEVLQYT